MHALLQWEQHWLAQFRKVFLILAEADIPESWQADASAGVDASE